MAFIRKLNIRENPRIAANAGVYQCKEIFTWDRGKTCELLCADCFDVQINGLSRFEIAELVGSEVFVCGQ